MIVVIPFHRLGLAREGDTGGGGVKETFYAAARSPSLLPSELARISSRKGRGGGVRKPKPGKLSMRETCTCRKRVPKPDLRGLEPLLSLGTATWSRGTQRRPCGRDLGALLGSQPRYPWRVPDSRGVICSRSHNWWGQPQNWSSDLALGEGKVSARPGGSGCSRSRVHCTGHGGAMPRHQGNGHASSPTEGIVAAQALACSQSGLRPGNRLGLCSHEVRRPRGFDLPSRLSAPGSASQQVGATWRLSAAAAAQPLAG